MLKLKCYHPDLMALMPSLGVIQSKVTDEPYLIIFKPTL